MPAIFLPPESALMGVNVDIDIFAACRRAQYKQNDESPLSAYFAKVSRSKPLSCLQFDGFSARFTQTEGGQIPLVKPGVMENLQGLEPLRFILKPVAPPSRPDESR